MTACNLPGTSLGSFSKSCVLALALALALVAFSTLCFGDVTKRRMTDVTDDVYTLRTIAVADVQRARQQACEKPWLITGLLHTPELLQWRSEWAVEQVRVLSSPTGVFAAYGTCTIFRTLGDASKIEFSGDACRGDGRCIPVHSESVLSTDDSTSLFSRGPVPKEIYLRGHCGTAFVDKMRTTMQWPDLLRISPYLSGEGAVTNLHWDGADGILAQTSGSKLVSLFAPGTMPAEAASSSPCARRSYEAGATCPSGATLTLRLEPGLGLYIPVKWAHHITSLSPRTLGAVWRFAQS